MANGILTPSVIARETLSRLKNNLVAAKKVTRAFDKEFGEVGDTVKVERPIRYEVKSGKTLQVQDVEMGNTTIVVDQQKHVGIQFDSQDLALDPVSFGEKFIEPGVSQLAHEVDKYILGLYDEIPNWAGTPGNDINSFADFAKGPERLDHIGVPDSMRCGVLSVADSWALLGSQTALSDGGKIVQDAYRRALIGDIGGVETFKTQQIRSHTVGSYVSGASCTASAVTYASVMNGAMTQDVGLTGAGNAKTFLEGDVIQFSGVYDVNPNTKDALPHLKDFVVRADATSTSGGAVTLTIYPAIITSGAHQNCSAAPSSATVTRTGTASTAYRQNLVYHPKALALAVRPLPIDPSMSFAATATDKDTGLAVRIARQYDINNDNIPCRIDILFGGKAIYPELATRLSGSA
jgi:hypothetical protein